MVVNGVVFSSWFYSGDFFGGFSNGSTYWLMMVNSGGEWWGFSSWLSTKGE